MFDATSFTRRDALQVLLQGTVTTTLATSATGLSNAADAATGRTVPAVPGTFEIK